MSEHIILQFNGQLIETDARAICSQQAGARRWPWCWPRRGIVLEEPHWEVVRFVRAFIWRFNTSPPSAPLVKAMEKQYGPEKGSSRYLYSCCSRKAPPSRPPRSQASPSR